MPRIHLDPPLAARNGRTLNVLTIDRISTKNQDPKSNDDQLAFVRRWVEDRYDGAIEWTRITGQGSGECIDRKEVRRAEDLVNSGQFDLVIMEDLGRHLRRSQATVFCEACEDTQTRLVAINDHIDTAKDWRLEAFFAAIKHEQSNKDTSERIKRTLRNRFSNGGVVQCQIFGYIKPAGAKSENDLRKDPEAQPIYDEWFRKLEDGASFSEVADWLNRAGVRPGRFCRNKTWDCAMVARVTNNPILKGLRIRNRLKSRRINKTGKYRCVKAPPEERLERNCPHLAFIEARRYDRVIRMLTQRNARWKRGKNGPDPLVGRPKKRTPWPGQHLYCGICGRPLRYGGHGQNDHLLCRGAYEYRCWNAVTVDGPLVRRKLLAAVFAEIEKLPDFDAAFHDLVASELRDRDHTQREWRDRIDRDIRKFERQIAHIVGFIKEGGASPSLREELASLEADKDALLLQRDSIEQEPNALVETPSIDAIKELARNAIGGCTGDAVELGNLMRRLVPKIWVYPYRLRDGGRIVHRAKFSLSLVPLLPQSQHLDGVRRHLTRDFVVDLFDPPQRATYRENVRDMRAAGMTERQVATKLGITHTAAQRAAALDRRMQRLGLSDPYVPVLEPPTDCGKRRRHKHPRYRFEPLDELPPSHGA